MSRPRPLEVGDQRHLPEGSIRWSIARQMRMVADMAGDANGQYGAVVSVAEVVMTREQVASFVPPNRRPANLDRWPLWRVRGNDTLLVHQGRS